MAERKNNFEFNKIEKQEFERKVLKISNLSKSFDDKKLFENINFTLAEKEKKALVGPNGCGKSTLLKIIAGFEKPDNGNITLSGLQVEYLPQELSIKNDLNLNVLDCLKKMTGLREIERRMQELEEKLKDEKNLLEYGDLQEQYERLNGYKFESTAKKILGGFNLDKYINKKLEELSSGERAKVVFGGLLLKNSDILLLDEPTNNLDLPSIIWLENFIKQSRKAYLIVSHDREFLDNVVEGVIQINPHEKNIIKERGNYSDFIKRREQEFERQKQKYEKTQLKISNLLETIREKKQWAQKGSKQVTGDKDKILRGYLRDRSSKLGVNATAMEKQVEKLREKIKQPFQEKVSNINLEPQEIENKNLIRLDQLEVGYKNGFSLKPVSLDINEGERIAFIGDNGSGKSTLLKTMAGEIEPLSGEVRLNKDLIMGRLMQSHEGLLLEETIFSYMQKESNLSEEEIYRVLSHFRFKFDYANKKISELSPGEREKLILAKFCAQKANMLILDEPTNHLDLESIEALENFLKDYSDSIIVASHDRYFLQKINLNNFYLISDGKINYLPDYNEYIKSVENKIKKLL